MRVGFLSLAGALILGCGVAFLAQNGIVSTSISGGSTLSGGASWDVVPITNSVAYQGGNAITDTGVELYRIDIANPANSNRIRVNMAWLDPYDAAAALHNPKAFILVGLYHEVGTPSSGNQCPAGDIFVDDPANGALCLAIDAGEGSQAALTRESADAFISSTTAGQASLYLIASIVVGKGDYTPPGQQGQLDSLSFYASAEMVGQ